MIIDTALKDKVHKRLRIRLTIYFVISVLILGVSVFHIIKDGASFILSSIGLVSGVIIGTVFSRIQKISWDKKASHVIAVYDGVGIFFLALYILFEIFRNQIVGEFISGPSVVAVSFALFSGLMYGRVIGTKGKIDEIFRQQGII